MLTVLNEIDRLRNGRPYNLDINNTNRYRIVVNEQNGTKTAYCFSSPIFDSGGRIIDLSLLQHGDEIVFTGSDSEVIFEDGSLKLKNSNGVCSLKLNGPILEVTDRCAYSSNTEISPTLNGLVFKARCDNGRSYSTVLTVDKIPYGLRANNKALSIMTSHFKPFVTISCIGAFNSDDVPFAPCELQFHQLNDTEYFINVVSTVEKADYIMFEVNCHEPKLFLDTTVESRHTRDNNAFGGIAYIGTTDVFGEQWLYSRPELSVIYELFGESIHSVVMNIPNLNHCTGALSVYGISSRFCSFGSNWENKISMAEELGGATSLKDYHRIDITELLTDQPVGRLKLTEGLIIKPKSKDGKVAVIPTGDSCYAPQILEVNFS